MSSDERNGGGGGSRPRKDSPTALAVALPVEPDPRPLEISSRGKVVIRSSSHPPGDAPRASEPPVQSTPPAGRVKRDTPAERPRKRREARQRDSDPRELARSSSSVPPAIESAAGRATVLLWAVIIALSASLAYALIR